VDLVKKITDDFLKFGKVKRGLIGITFTELNSAAAKELGIDDLNGLYVRDVIENGGAAKAGIKKGDIITKIDKQVITRSSTLQESVARMHPGDKVNLTFKREGKEKTVSVTLQGQEESKEGDSVAEKRSSTELYNKLGAGFVPLSEGKKKQMGLNA